LGIRANRASRARRPEARRRFVYFIELIQASKNLRGGHVPNALPTTFRARTAWTWLRVMPSVGDSTLSTVVFEKTARGRKQERASKVDVARNIRHLTESTRHDRDTGPRSYFVRPKQIRHGRRFGERVPRTFHVVENALPSSLGLADLLLSCVHIRS